MLRKLRILPASPKQIARRTLLRSGWVRFGVAS